MKATSIDAASVEPLVHSPASAAKRLNKSVTAIYAMVATGELKTFKDGKRRCIPDSELTRYVERKLSEVTQ